MFCLRRLPRNIKSTLRKLTAFGGFFKQTKARRFPNGKRLAFIYSELFFFVDLQRKEEGADEQKKRDSRRNADSGRRKRKSIP